MTSKHKPERFFAQVSDQVRLVERRLDAVVKQSTIAIVERAQRSDDKPGGRMPVVTGFLRNSGRIGIGGLPKGAIRGEKGRSYNWDAEAQADMILQIANTQPGDRIFFGWTAAYARRMETMYGYLRGAAEQWTAVVNAEAQRALEQIK